MSVSSSPKENALTLLEQIRTEFENDEFDRAAEQVHKLHEQMQTWKRERHIEAARRWLDDALQDDVLAFDAGEARKHIERWQEANQADIPLELERYRERVAQRIQQKHTRLQVRGVMALCDELLQNAQQLEQSSEPPRPDFLLSQYYGKAHSIALSAKAEHSEDADLDRLVQRTERFYSSKETAAAIYEMALLQNKYTNALHNLEQLPDDMLIPRYTVTEDSLGEKNLNYQGMVAQARVREEIQRLARDWAVNTAQKAIKTAQQQLENHAPEEAVETLEISENIERFLPEELRAELGGAQKAALKTLRNKQTAEEHARETVTLAADEPLKAWEKYSSAQELYQWAEGLPEARQAVLKAMRGRLRSMISEADQAFERRDMQHVRQLYQQAQSQYRGKDSSVDELVDKLAEYNDMARRYDEYVQSGREIIERVRQLMSEDIVGANELLSQVETYPDIVLEAFPELYELRQQVNQRLNAEHTYNKLYPLLFSASAREVRQGIEEVNQAVKEFSEERRFPELLQLLQVHLAFLSAKEQAEAGETAKALQLLSPALSNPNHPDHEAAVELRERLQLSAEG